MVNFRIDLRHTHMDCDVPAIMMLRPQLECQYRIVPAIACQKLCRAKVNVNHLWHFLGCNANIFWENTRWLNVTDPKKSQKHRPNKHWPTLDMCAQKVWVFPFNDAPQKIQEKGWKTCFGTHRWVSCGKTWKARRSHVAVASAGDKIKPELSIKSWALAKEYVQALRSCSTGSSSDTWVCKSLAGWH